MLVSLAIMYGLLPLRSHRFVFLSERFLVALVTATLALRAQGLEEREPDARCKPHTVYKWKSANGLDYSYSLPPNWFKGGAKRDVSTDDARCLVVLCHGTGLDYRWGHANHDPRLLRPQDVLVSVSGTSPGRGESRLFLGEDADRKAFLDFIKELRQRFEPGRVFLYGHSQGGFFVLDFAGAHPQQVAGVVAHASGAWAGSAVPKALSDVPLVVQHGSADPVVPYGQSIGTRDAYVKKGMTMLLRRLEFYNHWPNEQRTHEALAFCDGMTCKGADHALDQVRDLLEEKKPDRYQWTTVPAFAFARRVLRRFEAGGDLAGADAKAKQAALALTKAIEAHAKTHVDALSKILKNQASLVLQSAKGKKAATSAPWIEWLLALREDFRGVDTVEAFVKALRFDDAAEAHAKEAQKMLRVFYNEKDMRKLFVTVAKALPRTFLHDSLPHDFRKRLRDIRERAKDHGITSQELDAARCLDEYEAGIVDGAKSYAKAYGKWRLPR